MSSTANGSCPRRPHFGPVSPSGYLSLGVILCITVSGILVQYSVSPSVAETGIFSSNYDTVKCDNIHLVTPRLANKGVFVSRISNFGPVEVSSPGWDNSSVSSVVKAKVCKYY